MNQTVTRYGRISTPRVDWLAKALPEDIIEPDLPIIDTHHHLWHRPGSGGAGESWQVPANRYLLHEFLEDCTTGHNIVASVFLQCHSMYRVHGPHEMRPVGETEFVAGIAAMSASGGYGRTRVAAGIVGYADLTKGEWVTPVLEAHIRAGGGRFRGVRHSAGYDPDPTIGNSAPDMQPGLYLRPDFRAGITRLSELGLSLDAWAFHPQLRDVVDLARAFPATNIVMGHCGGPLGYGAYAGRRDEVFANWQASVTELAKCQNVTMKLGGMMMRLAATDYMAQERPPTSEELATLWRPYIHTCIELFGPARCMFESNFPVEKMGIGGAALFNAFKRLCAGATADERRAMFCDTARRVYRLG